ncbi:hypothetical protein V5799_014007 [Amblyomma americanum]|uniref:Uncharacterized protein n=1 Tax=Amblyomma americanum TaxID=6943 RepID=A0AAQ4E4A3_AMBAM
MVDEKLSKQWLCRDPISSGERLAMTLRYLSSGMPIPDVAMAFRIGIETAREAIHLTCQVLWDVLSPLYMKPPTESEWRDIAAGFWHQWQFPNCLGAVDGKHVNIKRPKKSGSLYFNYKGTYSIVLMAVVDSRFVWIMGVSMAMTIRSLLRKSVTRGRILLRIVKRTLILFGLGIMTNTLFGANNLSTLRIPGVLQRLAFSYLVASTIHLLFAKPHEGHLVWAPLRDVLAYWPEWLLSIPILGLHLALTFCLPLPHCPRGYLGPGGLHLNSSFTNCTGGAAGYIDRTIFGNEHIYQTPDMRHVYHTHQPYDPEGTLGCLTSIFLVFLGLQAGKILLTFSEWKSRVVRWCCWGLACGVVAGVLCKFSKEEGWIPVNKNLWSVSFILSTASTAFFLLAILYYLIDVRRWWSGAPLTYPGMNSLVVYVGHEVMHGTFPWAWQCPESHWCYLFMNLWGTALWVVFAWLMFRRRLFISA